MEKKGRTVPIHLFLDPDPPKQKFNMLAFSHHRSIRFDLIQLFLKYAQATMAAHNYLGSQLGCDWGGRHRNTTGVQLHFVPMMPAYPAAQEIYRSHLSV